VSAGYTTTVCRDGFVAASIARDEDFDLLILDIGLPGQDGFEVLRRMRGRGERMPVLVLTARRQLEDTVAALEGGADDYLTKPFAFDELVARVRARVRTAHAERETDVLSDADLRLDLPRAHRLPRRPGGGAHPPRVRARRDVHASPRRGSEPRRAAARMLDRRSRPRSNRRDRSPPET
jgi:DNA-binding response OmpR family regulator